ncbi:ROK family protein [Nonomuraea harbinensis]|uniref:ROK family protein n=1 Tax=Nonomuraea harbinensis TaxID=1286938 RepID=A0ABW1C4F3_9ACTN|nr:ROK family protein [Nonomuraea harbinensis]
MRGGTRPASQRSMRQHNLALVMGTVAERGPVSRAAVAGHTGLTRAAVSSLVDELLAAGLLTELGPAANGRVGRPGSALMVSDRGPAGLGLEVGVEHLGVCVTDLRGQVRAWTVVDSPNAALPPAEVLARLSALADDATADAAGLGLRPVAAVMAVPGLVADASGTVGSAPNLGWHDVPVADLWPGALPPRVENEANLGALAELWAHPVASDFIHVSAESGIGAALVVGGRLFTGARGLAGELGHMPVHPDGPPCSCGARGCLEQYAAKAAVLRTAGLPSPSAPTTPGVEPRMTALSPDLGAAPARQQAAPSGSGNPPATSSGSGGTPADPLYDSGAPGRQAALPYGAAAGQAGHEAAPSSGSRGLGAGLPAALPYGPKGVSTEGRATVPGAHEAGLPAASSDPGIPVAGLLVDPDAPGAGIQERSGGWGGRMPGPDGIGLLAARAREGDARVVAALEEAGRALGTALAGAVNLLDPAAVVLGGAYAELGEWLVPPIRRELAARVTVREWDPEALTVSELGRRGPLLGAALATVRSVLEDPAALWA